MAVAASALVIPNPLHSEEATRLPDANSGMQLTQKLCIGCHAIGTQGEGTVTSDIPSMNEIANRPNQTYDKVRYKLIEPHAPMPKIPLTSKEIEDIIGYLDSLRDKASGPPLVPHGRPETPKPDYPWNT